MATACLASYNVIWDTPGRNSSDSMPLGNGDIGLNVWVEEDGDLVFYISKTDAWDENCRLLKLGRVRTRLNPNPFIKSGAFMQTLDLEKGEIDIRAGLPGSEVSLRLWVDANQPVVRIEVNSSQPLNAVCKLELWRTTKHTMGEREMESAYGLNSYPDRGNVNPNPVITHPDTILDVPDHVIAWVHRNTASIWADTLRHQGMGQWVKEGIDPLLNRTFGGVIKGDGMVRESRDCIRSTYPATNRTVSIYVHTNQTDTIEEWLNQTEDKISEVNSRSMEQSYEDHRKWWGDFWNRSWIHLSSDSDPAARIVSQGYALQRFIIACGGRGAFPIKFNGSIFTVDSHTEIGDDPDFRMWGGPYWMQNSRLIYWPMLAAGDYDLVRPFFRMFLDMLPFLKARTSTYFGHGGAYFPETMYFWGAYTNMNYYYDRTDRDVSWIGESFIRYHYTGTLELLAMMLDYFDHTRDASFLDGELLPLANELLTFWDKHYGRSETGLIRMEPAQALETYWSVVDPTNDVAGLQWVLDKLLSLPQETVDQNLRRKWKRIRAEVPSLPTEDGDEGRYITSARELLCDRRNSENPELYAIFPFRIYGIGKPDLATALLTYSKRLTRGCCAWMQDDIQAAYLGLADEAKNFLSQRFSGRDKDARFPAFWKPSFDWTPEQDHGGVGSIALQAMLMQYNGRDILLFPAWPREWNVEFKLHAPCQTTLVGRFVDGVLEDLEVVPESRRKDVIVMGKFDD